jgi:SAM-dependent methyltransferase
MKSSAYQQSRHLEASEVYSATARCPVCLADVPRKPVFRLQESPAIDLLECPKCRVASAAQMPLPAVLDDYYANYWSDEADKLTFRDGEYLAAWILKYVSIDANRDPVRILDFGGGDGTLARLMARRLLDKRPAQYEIDVVDPAAEDSQDGDKIRLHAHRTLEAVSGPYDLILASAVLEHIPDANTTMRRLFSLAGHGGFFYARTPYVLPLARLHRNLDFTYPGHVHDMGSGFWGRVTETFGLNARVVHSGPSPVETRFTKFPMRTAIAWTLKSPAFFETWLFSPSRQDRLWNLVGGWEIVLQFE